ncbi:MAG: hypothetical protein HY660_15395 [Armatimonadetes bacterium]|nr:hypothetical protein [Armatimonadota bacterium]
MAGLTRRRFLTTLTGVPALGALGALAWPLLRGLRPMDGNLGSGGRDGGDGRPFGLPYGEVMSGDQVWACTDLGAFPRPLPSLRGLAGVVVMEDREPEFFFTFRRYRPDATVPLNRHGPLAAWSTQRDLRGLVRALQRQGIRVAVGFWNYAVYAGTRPAWLQDFPELHPLPGSSDLYPFVRLHRFGMDYAEFIGRQYARLRDAFGFDGLMLGDGFSGFRSFASPDLYQDQHLMIPRWTGFYRTVARQVQGAGGVLLAYDCMGFPYEEARLHGVDYAEVAAVGLDYLVYQSYPQAWGEYWLRDRAERFDLAACDRNLRSVRRALHGSACRLIYSVELEDSVEGWRADPDKTRRQMAAHDPVAGGRFLVWANDVLARRAAASGRIVP